MARDTSDPDRAARFLSRLSVPLVPTPWIRRSAYVAGVFIVVAFWTSAAMNRVLASRGREALRQRTPFVLNGMHLDLNKHVEPRFSSGTPNSRYLLLLSSDVCRYSRQAVTEWRSLLEATPFTPDDVVVLATVSGDVIPASLRDVLNARNVRSQVLHIHDTGSFAAATSLAATPGIVLLDPERRVRLVSFRLTETTRAEIMRFFAAGV